MPLDTAPFPGIPTGGLPHQYWERVGSLPLCTCYMPGITQRALLITRETLYVSNLERIVENHALCDGF